jgi:Protein of unknown function (DUF1236)
VFKDAAGTERILASSRNGIDDDGACDAPQCPVGGGVALIAVAGDAQAQSAPAQAETLTLEQKVKISELISERTAPLAAANFSIAVDSVVPPEIEVHALPSAAEQVAPRLHGLGYVVIEELIALVDTRTRKVALVFPRWRAP